jgi:hypothetical protein
VLPIILKISQLASPRKFVSFLTLLFLPLFELFGRNIGKLATPLGEAEGDDALLQQGDGVDHPTGQLLTHDPHNRLLNLQDRVYS